ncbi:hypothetical protein ACNPQK_18635 [Acinetobacter guillouiae]|uniref:phage tail fiber protein n=1 Tax=Acinetobacter guillouiae TaxID=106649 RepID=UPI003AF83092
MTYQYINLGTAPSGAGGDTFRSTGTKVNENFTNNTHAASRYVGTANGNLMEVGAFGLGGGSTVYAGGSNGFEDYHKSKSGFFFSNTSSVKVGNDQLPGYTSYMVSSLGDGGFFAIGASVTQNQFWVINGTAGNTGLPLRMYSLRHSGNTTVDGNGFIKSASPIVQLFADKIESNQEALEQEPLFEKVDVGHYLIKNTEGFSDNGWYIEMPKDANGNVLVAVQYQQLEDNTIEVKTFAKKFDEETGDIVPNFEKPRDIPAGRWIDIRLKALPQPEIEIPKTPTDFQPTNLAQAVAEALKDDSKQ